jgi:hypothetical protein
MRLLGLSLAFVLLLGVVVPAAEAQNLWMVDANDNLAGQVVGFLGSDYTRVPVIDFSAFSDLFGMGFFYPVSPHRGATRDYFMGAMAPVFTTTDCTGTLYLETDPASVLPVHGVAPPGQTVYAADEVTAQSRSLQSRFFRNACELYTVTASTVTATAVLDLDTYFTQPFRLNTF